MQHPGGKKYVEDECIVVGHTVHCQKPFYLRSRGNGRGHWSIQYRRDKECRMLGQWMAAEGVRLGAQRLHWTLQKTDLWIVRMIRYSTGSLDTDTLATSFKNVRDGIADILGTNDHSTGRVTWLYDQQKSKAFGVRVVLERLSET